MEAFSSSNLEFNNKTIISHKLSQFRMVVQNQEFSNNSYNFREHFVWLCEIFAWSCEINLTILLCLQHNFTFWSISHSYTKFRMIMQNGNIWFVSFLFSFISFPSSFSTSATSKSAQILVQTNCITSFIMHLDHH